MKSALRSIKVQGRLHFSFIYLIYLQVIQRKEKEMAAISAKIEDEQSLGSKMQKQIKELAVSTYTTSVPAQQNRFLKWLTRERESLAL